MKSHCANISYLMLVIAAPLSAIASRFTSQMTGSALSLTLIPANQSLTLSCKDGLYLKRSLRMISSLTPIPVQSLTRHHILIISDLGARKRIIQSLTFLPLGSVINTVPLVDFSTRVVDRALRKFPLRGMSRPRNLCCCCH